MTSYLVRFLSGELKDLPYLHGLSWPFGYGLNYHALELMEVSNESPRNTHRLAVRHLGCTMADLGWIIVRTELLRFGSSTSKLIRLTPLFRSFPEEEVMEKLVHRLMRS